MIVEAGSGLSTALTRALSAAGSDYLLAARDTGGAVHADW
jgi:hypothetical protein